MADAPQDRAAPTVTAVRLSRAIIDAAREEGALKSRSIAGQIEHWARLGRAIEARAGVEKQLLDRLLAHEPLGDIPQGPLGAAWREAMGPGKGMR